MEFSIRGSSRPLRWRDSDREIIDPEDIQSLAEDVADDIISDQYDGYKCRDGNLGAAIVFYLTLYAEEGQLSVHSALHKGEEENDVTVSVWVVRPRSADKLSIGDWVWDKNKQTFGRVSHLFADESQVELRDTNNVWETDRDRIVQVETPS